MLDDESSFGLMVFIFFWVDGLGLDQAKRLRLGERTKRKVVKFKSSSNNMQVKGKWWYGDLRLRFSLTYC
ncbi:unnamed protein product [Brassica rapa]|uniref:Uncharacterized protein n=1 Tax=Brassica campestris TaxID=3711 RepID=A0A8D9I545_BRACM|nr:unnamed protein product [Brassica rapa]